MNKDILKPRIKDFILKNETVDPVSLILKYHDVDGIPIKVIAEQIIGRQKAKTKLPDWYKTPNVIYPAKLSLEQCSSSITAHYKASLIKGESFADLTGGMGIDTLAFARLFKLGHYIEQNKALAELAEHNFIELGANNVSVHHQSAEEFLESIVKPLGCIYIDPARRDEHKNKVFMLSDCTPDVVQLLPDLLKKSSHVLVKTSPMMDIEQALKELKNIHEVHVVSVDNECKEVLYLISQQPSSEISLHSVNFKKGIKEAFSTTWSERITPNIILGDPEAYLYEPNSSLMKSGAHNAAAVAYGLKKLHPNTHLYTSDLLKHTFPGRVFKVNQVVSLNKKELRKALPKAKANITVRNFKMDVETIRKKTGIKAGGEDYLFACTLKDGQLRVVVAQKI